MSLPPASCIRKIDITANLEGVAPPTLQELDGSTGPVEVWGPGESPRALAVVREEIHSAQYAAALTKGS
jgi:hypothetical protein